MSDFACGTGTLILASFRRINQLRCISLNKDYSLSNKDSNSYKRQILKDSIERGLIGLDISPIAIHLTAASLVQSGNTMPYNTTRLGWVKIGTKFGYIGSLEYLSNRPDLNMFGEYQSKYGRARGRRTKAKDNGQSLKVRVDDSSVDWILMNPPYSRTSSQEKRAFGLNYVSDEERIHSQKRWEHLIKKLPATKESMAMSFLVLGRNKCKSLGSIGFVLPITFAMTDSWVKTRKMIEL